ncbi:MAG: class I tRNA ligase family protein [Bradymonadaceae bacterium]
MYEMFMGPLEQTKPWDQRGVTGVHRFLNRVWRLFCGDEGLSDRVTDEEPDEELKAEFHKTIETVTEDTDDLRFNTAIARMMEFVNFLFKQDSVPRSVVERFTIMLSPYAPHLAEEVWERLGHDGSVAWSEWPDWDEELTTEETVEIGVQVGGKTRGSIQVPAEADKETAVEAAHDDETIRKYIEDESMQRVIYVPGQILNFVLED